MRRDRTRRAFATLCLLFFVCLAPWTVVPPQGAASWSSPSPLADPPVWADSLDDLSHVYVPDGGLVGIEVSGGDVHLLPGQSEGWVASSTITCPPGHRYDLVLLEVDMPGASYVKISMLNASRESTEIGFANESIIGYTKVLATDLSVVSLLSSSYPQLRIQVNLYAAGTDRPRLLAWSLHYAPLDEWYDDFLGTGKMKDMRKLNLTGGRLELDLSGKASTGGGGDYDPYPTMLLSRYEAEGCSTFDGFYPNVGRTGYTDKASVSCTGTTGLEFGDLDGDGDLDLLVVNNRWGGTDAVDSQIWWGDGGDAWASTGATALHTVGGRHGAIGDFNGDGEPDVVVGAYNGASAGDSVVFLNQGGGTFDAAPDITFTGIAATDVAAGDLDNDGYDDIVFAQVTNSKCYLGGPSGPDTTADLQFPVSPDLVFDVLVKDLDLDGYLDVMFSGAVGGKVPIFIGGPTGPDTTADYSLDAGEGAPLGCAAGDINGDGYVDLAYSKFGTNFAYFEGSSSGWSDSLRHIVTTTGLSAVIEMADVDRDGYDDIITTDNGQLLVFMGGTSWPTTASISKAGVLWAFDIAIAIPPEGSTKGYRGSFTTQPIALGSGMKWDVAYVDGTFPRNTSITMTVLDFGGKTIAGMKDVRGADVDLSPVTDEITIHIRVVVTSEFNTTTPVLDRITVKWMARGMWREQFYGLGKVERDLGVGVQARELTRAPGSAGSSPSLLITSLREDKGYTTSPVALFDAGGFDYRANPQITFDARGTSAVDAGDVDGDGFTDVAFAVHHTDDSVFDCWSPVFLGSAVGFRASADHEFETTGASDVSVRDLNGDGLGDVVFAQETTDGVDTKVNSTLFWGSATGWNGTPDVQFATWGAAGLAVADIDGDGRLDLVFACSKDDVSTATDSMVFLQGANGFCGTVPSYGLPTKAARAVAAADIDGDGLVDLAFANSFSTGSTEIDSYVYWGKAGGGFDATPAALRTTGAEDVKAADLDGDGDVDLVFANMKNNAPSYRVESYIYLSSGGRAFPVTPSAKLPAAGAVAVEVADLDGTGRKDILIACEYDGARFIEGSPVYLGGASGWPSSPSFKLAAVGATDVRAVDLLRADVGGYMSKAITPEDVRDTSAFHTLTYTAALGARQSGMLRLVDATTWQPLAGTALAPGTHEWVVKDAFWVKEHPSIRVLVTVDGLDQAGEFALDDLSLNWTKRVREPPRVHGVECFPAVLPRLTAGMLVLNVSDEYDPVKELEVTVEHRASGTTAWGRSLFTALPTYSDGAWRVPVYPRTDAQVGLYDVRVRAMDSDLTYSPYAEFTSAIEVRNNRPSTPVVTIVPSSPTTMVTLQASIVTPSWDVESGSISYRYRWFRDGELQAPLTGDTVPATATSRGENWTLEVRAFDGVEEGLPARAWVVIINAPPQVRTPLPNPEIGEDELDDQWLNLSRAFEDPDGDVLTYSVNPVPVHIQVIIDGATGAVTLNPERDWSGEEAITFIASDGLLSAWQTAIVIVTPVNDMPRFLTVNGQPITTDLVEFTIDQGERLVIDIGAEDIEGDELAFSCNSTIVDIDGVTGRITFQPDNNEVGTLRFAVTLYDVANPSATVALDFSITVLNVNDPVDAPRIVDPKAGDKYKVNVTFSLIGLCTDPDTQYGQTLIFRWYWNGTNLIGEGSSLTWNFTAPGTYNITLTVSDGESERSAHVLITIEPKDIPTPPPPPPPPEDDDGGGIGTTTVIGIMVVLIIIGALVGLAVARRRERGIEAAEIEKEEDVDRRDSLERMAAAVKATADQMEAELGASRSGAPPSRGPEGVPVERGVPGGEAVTRASQAAEGRMLSMRPQETEAVSRETQQLFEGGTAAPPQDQERMRVDNLKRRYATAIGRMPYGIPAPDLKAMDWNDLAALLATGQKKTLMDGHEATLVKGKWYYSDPGDSSTFLKEHGAIPRAGPRKEAAAPAAAPAVDRATLLAKLDERYIMGEISEQAYERLKRKYSEEAVSPKDASKDEWVED